MKKGTLNVVILEILSGGKEYGFRLAQKIRMRSENFLKAGAGSLYPALYKLEMDKYIASEWDYSVTPARKYYAITQKGLEMLADEKQEWGKLIKFMSSIIGT
jgi:DNA-binding PadR family transcriptional regulator